MEGKNKEIKYIADELKLRSILYIHANRMDLYKIYYFCPITKIFQTLDAKTDSNKNSHEASPNFNDRIIKIDNNKSMEIRIVINNSTYKLRDTYAVWILSEDKTEFLNGGRCLTCSDNKFSNECLTNNKKINDFYEKNNIIAVDKVLEQDAAIYQEFMDN